MDKINGIPDEMLAAFIDHNAMPVESLIIKDAVAIDNDLGELLDIAADIKEFRLDDIKTPQIEMNLNSHLNASPDDSKFIDSIQKDIGDKIIDKLL